MYSNRMSTVRYSGRGGGVVGSAQGDVCLGGCLLPSWGVCLGGVCPGGGGDVSAKGVSTQGDVCLGGVYPGVFCPGGVYPGDVHLPSPQLWKGKHL